MKNILILSDLMTDCVKEITKYFLNRSDLSFKIVTTNKKVKVIKGFQKHGLDAFYLTDEEIEEYILSHNFDLIVLASFSNILPKEITDNNKIINIHDSLLPKYQGINPIQKAFINREFKTGITIHEVNEIVNSGKILFQKEIEINSKWNLNTLKKEIQKLENYYYPRIVEKILGLNVLVLGNSSKEHVIIQKIANSPFLNRLFLADTNPIFENLGEEVCYKDYEDLAQRIKKLDINLVITATKKYFFSGLVDVLSKYQIKVIGVNKKHSQIENSKIFTKKLLQKYDIKTSQYCKVSNEKEIDKSLKYFKNPVIKANGYTSAKGVYYDLDYNRARFELQKLLNGKFDSASKTCLIEEKIFGYEITLYSIWDGETLLHLPLCQTDKKNEIGLNTSGLASICPIELDKVPKKNLENYKLKLKKLLINEKIKSPFVFCSNLIVSENDIYVLGCNVSFGDCDTEALFNFVSNDWLELFFATVTKSLFECSITTTKAFQITSIALYSKGYPLKTRKNLPIKNIEKIDDSIEIYFSNIINHDGETLSLGDNILTVVSDDKSNIYKYLNRIGFEDKAFKTKIQLNLGK